MPEGKVFRLSFDDVTKSLRVICRDRDAFSQLQDAFSVKNEAAFFSERYGYKAAEKLYAINKFGFFAPGLLFDVLSWIRSQYGSTSCIAVSQNCKQYIEDFLMPLKPFLREHFKLSNISDDLGRNNELERLGKSTLEYRSY